MRLFCFSYLDSPGKNTGVGRHALPSSRGSSQPRDGIHISHITGEFFTVWATTEAQLKHLKYLCTKAWVNLTFGTVTIWILPHL